jgi:hypothetical protein
MLFSYKTHCCFQFISIRLGLLLHSTRENRLVHRTAKRWSSLEFVHNLAVKCSDILEKYTVSLHRVNELFWDEFWSDTEKVSLFNWKCYTYFFIKTHEPLTTVHTGFINYIYLVLIPSWHHLMCYCHSKTWIMPQLQNFFR